MGADDKPTERLRPKPRWNQATSKVRDGAAAEEGPAVGQVASEPRFIETGETRFIETGELGRGGMGRVIAATDTSLARVVAIKQALLTSEVDRRRFEREVRITAQLEHPSIVPIYDIGNDAENRPYYVMRRIEGQPLSDCVSRASAARERLGLLPNVLAAIDAAAFAHARGIIHRDIKPWNILVGAYGETLLIDWGLARRVDEPDAAAGDPDLPADGVLTLAGEAYGTPGYMAPEQARGEVVDARTDVYALGATLFFVLTGESTLENVPKVDWTRVAKEGAPPNLERLDPAVPAELGTIIGKAMATRSEDRYADAGALASDVRAFLAGQLVAAHRYTSFERVRRFARRHRLALTIATVALVAIGATGVVAIRSVLHERDQAAAERANAEAGERLADDRAEVILLDRARGLATRNPTLAVAQLRQLRPDSRHLRRARDIAAVAAANGIARGKIVHAGSASILSFAGDGRRLLSAGEDGTLQVHDLASGESRVLHRGNRVEAAVWTDDGTSITYAMAGGGLYVVTVATGTVRVLDPSIRFDELSLGQHSAILWSGVRDRVRYFDLRRRLVAERSTSGSDEIVLIRGVAAIAAERDRWLVDDNTALRLIDPDGEHVLLRHPESEAARLIAFDATGARAATVHRTYVVEWDLHTRAEIRRWQVSGTVSIFYAGSSLYASKAGPFGALDQFRSDGIREVLRGTWRRLYATEIAGGVATVTNDGALALLDDNGVRRFPHERVGTRAIAGSRTGSYLATATSDGMITWWDLRHLRPTSVRMPDRTAMCAFDGERIYAYGEHTLAIPRAGGPPRTVDAENRECRPGPGSRIVTVSDRASFGAPSSGKSSWAVVDGATGELQRFETPPAIDLRGAIFYVGGRTIFEMPTAATKIERWSAPSEVGLLSASGRWIAASLPSDREPRVARIDRQTGEVEMLATSANPELLVVTAAGTVWYSLGRAIHRSLGTGTTHVTTLAGDPRWLAELPDDRVAIQTSQGSIWTVSAETSVLRGTLDTPMLARIGRRSLASIDGLTVMLRYLDTGEQLARDTGGAIAVALANADRTLAVQATLDRVDLYDDPVPAEPGALFAWIDATTNAVVDPQSDALTWR